MYPGQPGYVPPTYVVAPELAGTYELQGRKIVLYADGKVEMERREGGYDGYLVIDEGEWSAEMDGGKVKEMKMEIMMKGDPPMLTPQSLSFSEKCWEMTISKTKKAELATLTPDPPDKVEELKAMLAEREAAENARRAAKRAKEEEEERRRNEVKNANPPEQWSSETLAKIMQEAGMSVGDDEEMLDKLKSLLLHKPVEESLSMLHAEDRDTGYTVQESGD